MEERPVERNLNPQSNSGGHEVQVINRERLHVTGVLHVDSFDERQVILDTRLGTLTLMGQDLQIRQLDLEAGQFAVEGLVTGLNYAAEGRREKKGQTFFERLLR